jgi:hypothetical protein
MRRDVEWAGAVVVRMAAVGAGAAAAIEMRVD